MVIGTEHYTSLVTQLAKMQPPGRLINPRKWSPARSDSEQVIVGSRTRRCKRNR